MIKIESPSTLSTSWRKLFATGSRAKKQSSKPRLRNRRGS